MISYILKVTLVWTILLITYELLYKNSGRFTTNRLYLLCSLLTGLLRPLVKIPWPLAAATPQDTINRIGHTVGAAWNATPDSTRVTELVESTFNWNNLFMGIYLTIAAGILLVACIELLNILRKAVYGTYISLNSYKIFETGRKHAPFSFMGWIFIGHKEAYTAEGLLYILEHESAHNRRRHWLDILLMQVLCVVCWFHPLVWRYRFLLKMQHEYEADRIAAGSDAYGYGHFLLEQTLLRGTPSIAHSFHFSPVKNRINMLSRSKVHHQWKYAAIIPVLALCSIVMAASTPNLSKTKSGSTTFFKGNRFVWKERPDKDYVVSIFGSEEKYVRSMPQQPIIVTMNGDSVYYAGQSDLTPPQYRAGNQAFSTAITAAFKKAAPNAPDSIELISIFNLVIDKTGRLVYYDLNYQCTNSWMNSSIPFWDEKVDQVIESMPLWLPALKDGEAVASFVDFQFALDVHRKTRTFQARPLSKEEVLEMLEQEKKGQSDSKKK
jgi:hypothetical protein